MINRLFPSWWLLKDLSREWRIPLRSMLLMNISLFALFNRIYTPLLQHELLKGHQIHTSLQGFFPYQQPVFQLIARNGKQRKDLISCEFSSEEPKGKRMPQAFPLFPGVHIASAKR